MPKARRKRRDTPVRKNKSPTLHNAADRRRAFIQAVLENRDPRQAVAEIYALATKKSISSTLTRLRLHPDVKAALERGEKARSLVASRHTRAHLEAQLSNLGFSDIADILLPDGTLRPLDRIAPETRAAIRAIRIRTVKDPNGGAPITSEVNIQLQDKLPPLRMLAEMHSMVKGDSTTVKLGQDFNIVPHSESDPAHWRLDEEGKWHQVSPHNPAIDVTPPSEEGPRPLAPQDEADRRARELYEQATRTKDDPADRYKRDLEVHEAALRSFGLPTRPRRPPFARTDD